MGAPTTRVASAVLADAIELAARAPSIHNTQPWSFALRHDAVDLFADPSRQLLVLDPRARQLFVSCGCALFHLRVGIAAAGFTPVVALAPDVHEPELVARVAIGEPAGWTPLVPLRDVVAARRTNRREFLDRDVPDEVVADLVARAEAEGATLVPIAGQDQRELTAQLSRIADSAENRDGAYRAELAAWTTNDPRRRDGVQAASIPYGGADAEPDELPMRTFDTRDIGWLPESRGAPVDQCLLLFTTPDDEPGSWLRVGQALEHVWLQLTRLGFSASPLTQVVEVRETNERLRVELGLDGRPQLLLRVGRAPLVPPTPRRDVADLMRRVR